MTTTELIALYNVEYTRTTGKVHGDVGYKGGWFRVSFERARRVKFEKWIATLKSRPTVTNRVESVNGVPTMIEAHQHVVTSYMVPHRQVIEDRDTPWNCSVASEAYWSN